MRILKFISIFIFIFACSSANASYFEYCYLDGQVVKAAKASKKNSKIEFLVSHSVASTLENEKSYDSKVCSDYVGKTIKVKFRTTQKTQYTAGQSIKIRQFVVDAMTTDGMATFTMWEHIKP
jgi:hypothetical protein